MSDVNIRDATAEDARDLAALVVALNLGLGWGECRYEADDFLRDGLGPNRWFDTLVAVDGGELIGYAMFHRSYDTETVRCGSYLSDLYVAPGGRGDGVGWKLLAGVAARTQEWGGNVVWWMTTEENELGKRFFHRVAQHVPGLEVWVAEEENFQVLAGG